MPDLAVVARSHACCVRRLRIGEGGIRPFEWLAQAGLLQNRWRSVLAIGTAAECGACSVSFDINSPQRLSGIVSRCSVAEPSYLWLSAIVPPNCSHCRPTSVSRLKWTLGANAGVLRRPANTGVYPPGSMEACCPPKQGVRSSDGRSKARPKKECRCERSALPCKTPIGRREGGPHILRTSTKVGS